MILRQSVWHVLALSMVGGPVATDDCICPSAKRLNEWCGSCRVGYIAGLPITSHLLYEELDPHGHKIDPKSVQCVSCQAALKNDGFCKKCHMGFVRNLAYLSPLTYNLARGSTIDSLRRNCKQCISLKGRSGWCDTCKVGTVGNVEFESRAVFDDAVVAFQTVVIAIAKFEECRMCAIAIVLNGRCPDCKITYKDGKKHK